MDTPSRHRRTSSPDHVLGTVAGAAVLVLVLVVAVCAVADVPLDHAVDDPSATTGAHPLTGVLSNLGVLLWWTGATAALLTSFVLRRAHREATLSRYLLIGGLLTGYLALDDLFLIHDSWITPTPLPQPLFLGVLVLGFAWYLVSYRLVLGSTEWRLVAVAGFLFGASLAVDVVSDLGLYLQAWEATPATTFVEDSLKWLALVAWTTYLVRLSASVLVRSATRPAGVTTDATDEHRAPPLSV